LLPVAKFPEFLGQGAVEALRSGPRRQEILVGQCVSRRGIVASGPHGRAGTTGLDISWLFSSTTSIEQTAPVKCRESLKEGNHDTLALPCSLPA